MVWWTQRAVSALAGVIIVMSGMTASPASADEPCDLALSATVNGAVTSGDLQLVVTPSSDGWTFTATVPTGYELQWLDGDFGVTAVSDEISIGGGVLTRSSSIVGEFVRISACLMAPV